MNPTRFIAGRVRRHLAYLAVLAKAIDATYEKTESHGDRVRASEVAQLVATVRDVALSTPFRQDVRKAAKLLGFTRVVRVSNVAHYTQMKRRNP